ncbi:MAG: glycosyltransferase family 2 protein [Anaerolineales bacterium]|jgi:GT2 family glycosyltransferase
MDITVIILTLNQRDRTLQCLSNLLASQEPMFHTIVWDNGSQDDTTEAIEEAFPKVLVHHSPKNIGVAGGRNAAAELAIKTYNPTLLLFLDNDMLLKPGFVDALSKPFLEDEGVGQTQAKLRFMNDRERLNDGGGAKINFVLWRITPVGYGEIDRGQHDRIKECIACGGAMMVRTDVFQQLNGFDPIFNPFGPEDLDFSLRLQKIGYRALYVPQAVAYHVVSHTYGREYSEEYARHKSRHWLTFMRRHASPIQQLGFFLFGVPILTIQVLLREGKRGNLGALRGLVWGIFDIARPSPRAKGEE